MRLVGRNLKHARGYNIISDGIAPGSIQIPGDGAADRAARGSPDHRRLSENRDGHLGRLPALGRVPIGAKIRFELVTVEAADAARERLHGEFDRSEKQHRSACRGPAPTSAHFCSITISSAASIDAHCADG